MLGELIEKLLKLVAGNSLRVLGKERSREGEYDVVSVINDSGGDLQIQGVYLVSADKPTNKRDVFIDGQKTSLPLTIKNKSRIDLQPELGYVVTIFNGAGFFVNINLPRQIAAKCNAKSLLSEVTRGKSSAV
jgi:hypothetical protein